jgi:hypothetical protein
VRAMPTLLPHIGTGQRHCSQLPSVVAIACGHCAPSPAPHQVDLACLQEPLASLEYSGYSWPTDLPLLPLLLVLLVVVLLLMPVVRLPELAGSPTLVAFLPPACLVLLPATVVFTLLPSLPAFGLAVPAGFEAAALAGLEELGSTGIVTLVLPGIMVSVSASVTTSGSSSAGCSGAGGCGLAAAAGAADSSAVDNRRHASSAVVVAAVPQARLLRLAMFAAGYRCRASGRVTSTAF